MVGGVVGGGVVEPLGARCAGPAVVTVDKGGARLWSSSEFTAVEVKSDGLVSRRPVFARNPVAGIGAGGAARLVVQGFNQEGSHARFAHDAGVFLHMPWLLYPPDDPLDCIHLETAGETYQLNTK